MAGFCQCAGNPGKSQKRAIPGKILQFAPVGAYGGVDGEADREVGVDGFHGGFEDVGHLVGVFFGTLYEYRIVNLQQLLRL